MTARGWQLRQASRVFVSMLTNNSPGKLLPTPLRQHAGLPPVWARSDVTSRVKASGPGSARTSGVVQQPQQACYSKLTLDLAAPSGSRH